MDNLIRRLRSLQASCMVAAVVLFLGMCIGNANAFNIDTGCPDSEVRWDNTFRYTYGVRLLHQDQALLGNPNLDDGDRNFSKGTVTNRLDILSEFDWTYKKDYGVRVSGAFWYDQAYHDSLGNNSPATSNHLGTNGEQAVGFSDYAKRLFGGPSGELLDAFAFGKLHLGEVPVSFKIGRHTEFWGEALLFGGAIEGISYSQMPIDAAKAFSNPGSDAKELFRPLNNISAQALLRSDLSVEAQYFLQWERWRLPEDGTYLNNSDPLSNGGESIILAPGLLAKHLNDPVPDGLKDWGVATHWRPDFLKGSIGLYYRQYADMLPQAHLSLVPPFSYFLAYPDKVDLYGISFSKEIYGISVGSEFSYRHNAALESGTVILPSAIRVLPAGDTLGARGDTMAGVINFLGLVSARPPLFDTASWVAEFTWSHCDHVNQGEDVYLGRPGYSGIDHVTDHAFGVGFTFTPTKYQVYPGVDLSLPLSFSMGISGNSPMLFGDNYKCGTFGFGLSALIFSKYTATLQYVGFFGNYTTGPNGAETAGRGAESTLVDRDYLALTLKATF